MEIVGEKKRKKNELKHIKKGGCHVHVHNPIDPIFKNITNN